MECLNEVAQHVMSENPKKVGKWKPDIFTKMKIKAELTDEDRANGISAIPAGEERLLFQEHLTKATWTVGKYVHENGSRINSFYRYQLGELSAEK